MGDLFINKDMLSELVRFGKHKGETWSSVLASDPSYILWCDKEIEWIGFSKGILKEATKLAEEFQDE